MKISVVIPAYNETERLAACLDALMRQSTQPHEIIVVDNNSTDNTAQVAARYKTVRVLHEQQQGRVYARNTGFNAATGDIIARIDADGVVPDDWVAWIADYYTQPGHEEHAITGGAFFYNLRLPRFVSAVYNWLLFRFNTLVLGFSTLYGSNMALPRAVWQRVARDVCLDNDMHEDLDLAIHAKRAGATIVYDKSSTVRVEMRRMITEREALWPYLQMWPRTLRVHGYVTWVIVWVIGALGLYIVSPGPLILERIARLFGRKPLGD